MAHMKKRCEHCGIYLYSKIDKSRGLCKPCTGKLSAIVDERERLQARIKELESEAKRKHKRAQEYLADRNALRIENDQLKAAIRFVYEQQGNYNSVWWYDKHNSFIHCNVSGLHSACVPASEGPVAALLKCHDNFEKGIVECEIDDK
jgi:FtsZ-binding cell division protein ZapB